MIHAEIQKTKNKEAFPKGSDVCVSLGDHFLNNYGLYQLHLRPSADSFGDWPC